MEPEHARAMLLEQHRRIRAELAACIELARRFRAGEHVVAELQEAVGSFRSELEVHLEAEAVLIRIVLLHTSSWGQRVITRMVDDHRDEHAILWNHLTGSIDEVAEQLPALERELCTHMASEENTFLASAVLSRDAIANAKQGG
ncbi:MAG TPA: hemerythrin domain-containing protein [Kofleriaceae bacterium]